MNNKGNILNILLLFFSSLIYFASSSSYAQDYNTFGVRLAFNSSNVFSDIPDQKNKKRDFAFAGFYKMHIAEELIYFQPELGFSRKGSNIELDQTK